MRSPDTGLLPVGRISLVGHLGAVCQVAGRPSTSTQGTPLAIPDELYRSRRSSRDQCETTAASPSARRAIPAAVRRMPPDPPPALAETPTGIELVLVRQLVGLSTAARSARTIPAGSSELQTLRPKATPEAPALTARRTSVSNPSTSRVNSPPAITTGTLQATASEIASAGVGIDVLTACAPSSAAARAAAAMASASNGSG